MTTISNKAKTIRAAMQSANGGFFSVSFVKLNGENRTFPSARLGVKKFLKGGKNTTAHKPEYVSVYSMQDQSYKNVNLETVYQLKVNGLTINLSEEV